MLHSWDGWWRRQGPVSPKGAAGGRTGWDGLYGGSRRQLQMRRQMLGSRGAGELASGACWLAAEACRLAAATPLRLCLLGLQAFPLLLRAAAARPCIIMLLPLRLHMRRCTS